MKYVLAIAAVFITFATAYAQDSQANCRAAERELDVGIRSWSAAYRYFKRYEGWCSDGALAESLSSEFSTLLDKRWSMLSDLQRLSNLDPEFLQWVLLRTFSDTEDEMASCRIHERLTRCCPVGAKKLCASLVPRVFASPEQQQMCMSNPSSSKTCTGK